MNMSSYPSLSLKSLHLFLIFLFFLFVSTWSRGDHVSNTYIEKLCEEVLKMPYPQTGKDYHVLFSGAILRYYPNKNISDVNSMIEQMKIGPENELEKWAMAFLDIKRKFEHFEPLLKACNLSYVPGDPIQWMGVALFMNTLKKNIHDAKMKNIIQSILDRKMNSSEQFSAAFGELARIYPRIPKSKEAAILQLMGYNQAPSDFEKAFYDLAEDMINIMPICARLSCAAHMRYACKVFYQLYFYGNNDLAALGLNIKRLQSHIENRYHTMIDYLRHFASLAENHNEEEFKSKWNNLWTKKVKIYTKLPADNQASDTGSDSTLDSNSLKIALIQIWHATNDEAALSFWKKHASIWKRFSVGTDIKFDDMNTLKELVAIPAEDLKTVAMNDLKIKMTDINYAVQVFLYGLDSDRYKKCLWILIYNRDENGVDKIKQHLKRSWRSIPEEEKRFHNFCTKLNNLCMLSSNAHFHGADLNIASSRCSPSRNDYMSYLAALGQKHDNYTVTVAEVMLTEIYSAIQGNE